VGVRVPRFWSEQRVVPAKKRSRVAEILAACPYGATFVERRYNVNALCGGVPQMQSIFPQPGPVPPSANRVTVVIGSSDKVELFM